MWKCVIVGLALVLPGFLLNVEGRLSDEDRGARQGLMQILRDLFRQDFPDQEAYNRRLQAQQAQEQAFGPPGALVDEGIVDTGSENAVPVNKEVLRPLPDQSPTPEAPPKPKMEPRAQNNLGRELNLQAGAPQALPLSQQQGAQNSDGATSGGISTSSIAFIMIVAGCSVLAAVGIAGAGVCWYKYNKAAKAATDVEYPAYGVTGPTKDRLPSPGDRKLAQSAQMYHYQHQKQQMIAMEKANGDMKHDASDDESEEDTAEGDYTVYECPGLAPTGEMEVKNPLFRGDETPSTPQGGDGDHQ